MTCFHILLPHDSMKRNVTMWTNNCSSTMLNYAHRYAYIPSVRIYSHNTHTQRCLQPYNQTLEYQHFWQDHPNLKSLKGGALKHSYILKSLYHLLFASWKKKVLLQLSLSESMMNLSIKQAKLVLTWQTDCCGYG